MSRALQEQAMNAEAAYVLRISSYKVAAKVLRHVLMLGVFGWVAIVMVVSGGHWLTWIIKGPMLVLCGFTIKVGLIQIVEMLRQIFASGQHELRLGEKRFEISPGTPRAFASEWRDVSEFLVSGWSSVVFEDRRYRNEEWPDDNSFYINDIAGLSATEVAAVMNHWRTRALGASGHQGFVPPPLADCNKPLRSRKGVSKLFRRKKKNSLEEILALPDANQTIIFLDEFIGRKGQWGDALDKLTQPQRNFFHNQNLEREVNNGGFEQYFYNTSGDFAHETVASLRAISANHTADLLQRAINEFPDGAVPKDRKQRQEILNSIDEKANTAWGQLEQEFFKYEDDLNALSLNYVNRHLAEFDN